MHLLKTEMMDGLDNVLFVGGWGTDYLSLVVLGVAWLEQVENGLVGGFGEVLVLAAEEDFLGLDGRYGEDLTIFI